jgi:hypothetical protein
MTKHKQRKKKQREREVKQKLLRKREKKMKQDKEDRKQRETDRRAYVALHGVKKPYRKPREEVAAVEAIAAEALKKDQVKSQLEHNMKILEALNDEYEKEQSVRAEVNEKLESKGGHTIAQKMEVLQQEVVGKIGELEENSKTN